MGRVGKIRLKYIKTMKSLLKVSVVTLLCAGSILTAKAQTVVYDNSTGDTHIQYTAPSGSTYGNQVTLGSTERFVTDFIFQYWGTDLNGATAQLRFYANNGATDTAGFNPAPSTLLYDSGAFALGNGTGSYSLDFDTAALNGGVWVPDTFTWAVTFTTPTGSAGTSVFDGQSVGQTLSAIWYYNTSISAWELRADNTGLSTFAAKITASAVPEPATIALFGLGGIALVAFRRQVRR
jgi:hypothetical protein